MVLDLHADPAWHHICYRDPTAEEVDALGDFLRSRPGRPMALYHGTWAGHDILRRGLLPTCGSRTRSLQSQHGYVYLSIFPGMAETFGRMAYPDREVAVYRIVLPVRRLRPDPDQLRNCRLWKGMTAVRGTLASSLAYGHGARVRRGIMAEAITVHRMDRSTVDPGAAGPALAPTRS